MKLGVLISSLANQELKNSGVVEQGILQEEHLLGIVQNLNTALIELFSRFELKFKELILLTDPSRTVYKLTEEFAKTNPSRQLFKYIDDSNSDPFKNDIIKIKSVYNENGVELPINSNSKIGSVFVISHNEIQIEENNHNIYYLIYQARHVDILYPILNQGRDLTYETGLSNSLDLTQEVDIHYSLYEPLRSYVASKVLESIGGVDNLNISARLLQKYNGILSNLSRNDVININTESSNRKQIMRGFPR